MTTVDLLYQLKREIMTVESFEYFCHFPPIKYFYVASSEGKHIYTFDYFCSPIN